jgi:PPM family protein phosphatase
MTSQTLLVVVLVTVVGLIAFLLGERRATRVPVAPPPPAPPPADPRAASLPPQQRSVAPSAPRLSAPPHSASTPAQRLSNAPASRSVPPHPAAVSGPPAPPAAVPQITQFKYEEDDEDIDPTKIGASAQAPNVRVIVQPPVKKIVLDEEALTESTTRGSSILLISATAQTDRGLRRKRNEDSVGVLETANLYVVADGMGGYAGGDQASRMAVETMLKAFRDRVFEAEPHSNIPIEASELARSIQMANATIGEAAKGSPQLEGMGTTICAARFVPTKRRLFIAHVGDSRCYRLRDGVFTLVTQDHTMGQEVGVVGPSSAQLSRAVGIWPTVMIDITLGVPRPGDAYVLCSDGLTKMLDDDTIARIVRNESDPKTAVEALIAAANERGGKDNITVILVRVVPYDQARR